MNTPVSFELAKLLKEKGFDEKVKGRYCIKNIIPFKVGLFYLSDYELTDEFIYGPTIAETIMWLYEKHGIWIISTPYPYSDNITHWRWEYISTNYSTRSLRWKKLKDYMSPTEAYEAAIEYIIKNLI